MNICIFGSKCLHFFDEEWDITDEIYEYLEELIRENARIIIGDSFGIDERIQGYLNRACYKNVTVYVSGNHKRMCYNIGSWNEKHYIPNGKTPYVRRIDRDFGLVEDADYGVAIWNGDDKDTYIGMLCLAALGKKFRLFMITEDRWIDINSIDDLERLAGIEGNITIDDIRYVYSQIDYRAQYMDKELYEKYPQRTWISRLMLQQVSFDEKLYLLSYLGKKQNVKNDAFCLVKKMLSEGRDFKHIKHELRALFDFRNQQSMWSFIYHLYDEVKEMKSELYDLDDMIDLVEQGVRMVETGKLIPGDDPSKYQIDEEFLLDLAEVVMVVDTIRPIPVVEYGDGFAIIAGYRRWRAAVIAGLEYVPVVVYQNI